ncbi:MAG: L,D-transpeptidase family protein [Daejeonella sp.]
MKSIILLVFIFLSIAFTLTTDFLSDQKKYARVQTAYNDKEAVVVKKLEEVNLNLDNINILIAVYKHEQELDIYVKKKGNTKYKQLKSYDICSSSGKLGPKYKFGDNQVPEGFYYIDRFNPASSYYLSLGLSYPNAADKLRSKASNLGGDIFIHGECVTIGCMPMTNDKIKEIYIYAIEARKNGQLKIPVYIFPFRFTETNVSKFKKQYKSDSTLLNFWSNLKTGYDQFHSNLEEIKVTVNKNNGDYLF